MLGGLDFDPNDRALDYRHHVYIGAVADWHVDVGSFARKPLHGRELADIALLSWFELRHGRNLGALSSQEVRTVKQMCVEKVSRVMRRRIASLP